LRNKASILIAITAAAIAAAVLLFIPQKEPQPSQKKSPRQPDKTTPRQNSYAQLPPFEPPALISNPDATFAPATKIQTAPADKESLLAAINEAAITYDPASLPIIAPHLKSPDPEIRAAAVDAVVVLGDAAGASLLRQAAKTARSSEEAADLRQKADYLELPPATPEFLKEMKALREQRAAQRQTATPPQMPATQQTVAPRELPAP